jgi:hypothetical protein
VVDALGVPAAFEFVGRRGGAAVHPGDVVPEGMSATLEAHVSGPSGAVVRLLRDGAVVQETAGAHIIHQADGRRGAYRVEVRVPDAPGQPPIPWIVSNPIFVGMPSRPAVAALPPASSRMELIDPRRQMTWHTEADASSTATSTDNGSSLALTFRLGGGAPRNQFVALVLPIPPALAAWDRVSFGARASGPVRLSVQLRQLGDRNPPRWRRTVYLDRTPRSEAIVFDDMMPVPPNAVPASRRTSIGGLLLVLDTTNTAPGATGEIVFTDVALERPNQSRAVPVISPHSP